MKPEPLKDKWSILNCGFDKLDVKSAVEWLREQLTIEKYKKAGHTNWIVYVDNKIDKAFEDVK